MERLIQSILSFFAGPGIKKASPTVDTTPGTKTAELRPDALEDLVAQLRSWLQGKQENRLSKQTYAEQPKLREFNERIVNRQLSRIPRQPRVLPRLIQTLGDESKTHTDLAEIIQDEPALTNDLLAVVNKTVQKRGQLPVDSVEQAVFLVGFDGIRRAVTQAVTRPIMQGGARAEADFARRTWRWGLMCATACDLLEQQEKRANSELFMIGLMPAFAYLKI